MLPQVLDGISDGAHLLRVLVGDVDAELFLEGHHELHGIEAVRAQIVDERGAVDDLLLVGPPEEDQAFMAWLMNSMN